MSWNILDGVNDGVRENVVGENFKLYVFVVWKLLEDNDGKCARQGKEKDILETTTKTTTTQTAIVCLADKGNFIFSGTQRENERKFLRIVHNFPCHSEWGRKKNGKERTKKRRRRRKKMDIGKLFNCYTDVNSNFKQFLGIILLIQSIYLSISLFHINIYIFFC